MRNDVTKRGGYTIWHGTAILVSLYFENFMAEKHSPVFCVLAPKQMCRSGFKNICGSGLKEIRRLGLKQI